MRKQLLILVLAFLPLSMIAQEQGVADASSSKEVKSSKGHHSSGIYTGFSGGMMVHAGYLFSDTPEKVFSNTGLGNASYIKGLPTSGVCWGLGGSLRVHLLNHIHVGAEGFMSSMPLMKTGSNIRTGWGGAFCDVFTNWGKVRPMVGLTLGGGAMKRLYVPVQNDGLSYATSDSTHYNASYTKTPFFMMDPYIGLEIGLNNHMALLIRIDYMLPFGVAESKLTEKVNWSKFLTPSGPRLYVGIMFGHLKKD